jgi:hypothetical protein
MDFGFAKLICGKGFAKPRLFPFCLDLDFAVQEGAGGMHGMEYRNSRNKSIASGYVIFIV